MNDEASRIEPEPGESPTHDGRRLALSVLFDVAVALGVAVLALRNIEHCIPHTMVAGDAFMPIVCGWQQLTAGKLWAPSQPIYGYGLCAEYALAMRFSDDLMDLVRWTVSARVMAAPLTYLAARVLTPALAGTSLAAARVGALAAAMLLIRHPGITKAIGGGTHGYLAMTFVALAVLGLGLASTRRSRIALLIGSIAVPMAMMNHPYALLLAAGALALIPLLLKHNGWLGLVIAGVPTLALATLRLPPLQQSLGNPGNWEAMVGSDLPLEDLTYSTVGALNVPANYALAVGGLILLGMAIRGPAGGDRALRRSWGAVTLLAAISVPITALIIEYIRPYHVELAAPLLAVGVATGLALLADLALRLRRWPWSALALGPLLAWGSWHLASLPMELTRALCQNPVMADNVAGAVAIQQAIQADLATLPDETRLMTSNLQLDAQAHLDNVQPATLGLLLAGVSPTRMECCSPGEPVAWYWVLGTDGEDRTVLDRLVAEPGIDQLLGPPELEERLIVVRTAQARLRLRDKACELNTGVLWDGHYPTFLSWISTALNQELPVPASPVDCEVAGTPPMPSAEELAGSELATLMSAIDEADAVRWMRAPAPQRLLGRPVLLHVGRCDDPMLADARGWLDYYEQTADHLDIQVLSIIVDGSDEELPCGTQHGVSRAVGRARSAAITDGLQIDRREVRLYDHRGERRSTWTELVQTGNTAAYDLQHLLDRLDRERRAALEASEAANE